MASIEPELPGAPPAEAAAPEASEMNSTPEQQQQAAASSLKPPQVAALAKEEEDKLSDYVATNDSNAPSMQPSANASANNSGDEIEPEAADQEDEGDAEMGDGNEGDSKTPRQQRAQVKKDAKIAQSSNLERQRAGVGGKKLADSIKRFSYLLGQTDLFSHFCDLKKERDPEFAKLLEDAEAQAAPKRGRKSNAAGRRRKSEKEEDAELLNDEQKDGDDEGDAPFVFTESPTFVKGGQMRDYQVQGLNWMVGLNHNGINGILADEMGLGKTLQTISFLGYLKFIRNVPGPHLIVVPKSTQDNWVREVDRWVPGFKTVDLRGSKEERAQIMSSRILSQDFDIVITSYEVCQREKNGLKKISWEYIVIDEAHRIKNVDSILSQIVRLFDSRHRLLITGTPLQNNLQELWALLNFLLPDVFSSSEDFDKWFESRGEGDDNGDKVVQQLHKVLRPFLLRRVKADVEKSLLPKREINVYVGMTEMQRKWYRSLLEKDIDAVNGVGSKKEGKTRLLNIVMQLRKCCNHPYLFDGAEPGPPFTTDEHLVFNAGKMVVLDKLLKSMKAKGSRVLIFSQMSRMLDILEDYCHFREYKYCRLDGQTTHEDRMAAIDAYNAPDSDKFLFLLTTRAGGLGINLTTADIVVLFDSDWNPQADLQAMDRAHRIGQKKQVFVFRFVTEAAVEEKVLERAAQKLRLDQLVIQQGRQAPSKDRGNSKDDILEMIQHGAERIINSSESMTVEDDIDSIIRKGEERTAALNDKYSSLNIHDLANFTTEAPGTTTWEGEKFGGKKRVGNLWIEPASRRPGPHKEGALNVNHYYGNTLQTSGRRPGPQKAPRPPGYRLDFQFYPTEFYALQERDTAAYQRREGYVVPLQSDKSKTAEQLEEERQAAQDIIDKSEDLTEEERERKAELEAQGQFGHWGKREFQAFIRGCETYGRRAYDLIATEVEQKTPEEVAAYGEVFWERYKELDDWEKQIKKIDDAEDKRKNQNHAGVLLGRKIATASHPLQNLSIPYAAQTKGKTYSEEEDRFMLVRLDHHGYTTEGAYELIKKDILNWDGFRFDWFIKSRTPQEIQRRCYTLIQLIAKEADESIGPERANAAGKKKAAAAASAAAAAAANGTPVPEETNGTTATSKGKRKNPPSETSNSRAGTPQSASAAAGESAPGSSTKSNKKSRKA